MNSKRFTAILLCASLYGATANSAQIPQESTTSVNGSVRLPKAGHAPQQSAAVAWLDPVGRSLPMVPGQPTHFTLLQKNRMFTPHLLVVPVGSVVSFPNADPFFHNVFSLFNGKRFDLGLYEAGSTKEVTFSRAGVSYIFCNIHPEMSAVILALSTPLYATLDGTTKFAIEKVPPGDYDLHIWIEGTAQPALDRLTRRIHIRMGAENTVMIDASGTPRSSGEHLNKFGKPYDHDSGSTY